MPPQAFRSAARLPAGSADRFISAFLWIPPPIGGPFSGQSMSPKHILLIPALALLMYLGMYSWNQRTHILDNFAANTGLEASGVGAHGAGYGHGGVEPLSRSRGRA